jgi:hypothetical protein
MSRMSRKNVEEESRKNVESVEVTCTCLMYVSEHYPLVGEE